MCMKGWNQKKRPRYKAPVKEKKGVQKPSTKKKTRGKFSQKVEKMWDGIPGCEESEKGTRGFLWVGPKKARIPSQTLWEKREGKNVEKFSGKNHVKKKKDATPGWKGRNIRKLNRARGLGWDFHLTIGGGGRRKGLRGIGLKDVEKKRWKEKKKRSNESEKKESDKERKKKNQ